MREGNKETGETGIHYINEAIKKLSLSHDNHMLVYGSGNKSRMTGLHETASYNMFTFGIANRGASVRIGNETSRDDKETATYGLSTMQDEHIDFEPTEITDDHDKWYDSQVGGKFTFVGKSNKKHEIEINDEEIPDLPALVMMCKDAKKGKGDDLFLFFDEEGNPQDVKAYHVNEYIQDASGEKFTAKDFRTWGGTKLAAEEITQFKKKDDKKQRKKNITKMVKGVAKRLGNTPAVCRGSYIHPRFINDYLKGSFFRLWKETLGDQMYPLSESESHVIRYLENS